jgi:predicted methyltransferase
MADQRVSIKYQNGTSVEANSLEDAIVHLAHTGTDYLEEVVADEPAHVACDKCEGTGVVPGQKPERFLTAKQARDLVAQVDADAPVNAATFDDRVAAARRVARG